MEASQGSNLHRAGKWPRWDFNPHPSHTRGMMWTGFLRGREGTDSHTEDVLQLLLVAPTQSLRTLTV